ncbi:MAG: redoxin family protein [Planctomycetaceae bacterium]|nr:redoxin family protein [Planctomycetaceae bacterium]
MMLRTLLLAYCCLPTVALAAEVRPPLGTTVADLRFKDIRCLPRSLADFGKKPAYVFVMTTTHCPLVGRTLPKLNELHAKYESRGVQFVAVNVGVDDTIRDMAAQAIDYDCSFPFVKDADQSCVAALGVTRTPEVAVLNADRQLVYRGRVDDQLRLGGSRPEPTRRDLETALEEILTGRPVSVAETPVDGCLITAPSPSMADQPLPTFSHDVLPILQKRCESCHRDGTAAPFALQTYEQVVAQADMVAEVVLDQRMPPWSGHTKLGEFQNDPSLTRAERDTLVRWAKSGRPIGNPQDVPTPKETPPQKWRIGEPDLVVTMLETHDIPASGFVDYRHLVLPYVFLRDTWIEAVEIRPDNPRVVHHCNMAYVTSKGSGKETFITGHVPGGQPLDLSRFDNGVAFFVPQYAGLGLQIHYTTTGKPEQCKVSVGFRFPRRPVQKQLRNVLLDPHRLNIAPGHGAFPVRSGKMVDRDINLLGLFTHMHLRGKDVTFSARLPDGSQQTLLQIPNFNFEWQLGYEIKPGKVRLPKGTRIEALTHYDNSAFNPYNPDPTRTVPWGEQTYDEMFNGYVFFVDEHEQLNLEIDPTTGGVRKPVVKTENSPASDE